MGAIKYLLALLLILIPATSLADTHNAASCKVADVATAITASVNGDTVAIPTCEGTDGTWESGITVTKNITIQGTGYANTVINLASAFTAFNITGAIRLTGIGIYTTNAHTTETKAPIVVTGKGWRIDHCKLNFTGTGSSYGITLQGTSIATNPNGLIDNNVIENARILVRILNFSNMNAVFASDIGFGDSVDSDWVYIEDNALSKNMSGNVIDSNYAGKYVARFNTITNSEIQAHGFQSLYSRGTRGWEIYNNTFVGTSPGFFITPIFLRAGEGLVFNNSVTGTGWSESIMRIDHRRTTETFGALTLCDGDFATDGNESGEDGWVCRDQIGAGNDSVATTYTGSYPNYVVTWGAQIKRPMYAFGNTYPVGVVNGSSVHIQENRDYFDGGTWGVQTSATSPFNGTSGVGRGTIANRPTTCTTGVAYWATDEADWNSLVAGNDGQLYKCTATNTWSLYYTPYTYPHPLRTEEDADPTVVSVYVNGAIMTINFSKPITSAADASFTLTPSGAAVTVDCPAVETAATSMDCTISRALVQAETATYAYSDTKVIDAASNALANIGATAITGNLTPAEAPTSKLTVSKTGSGCTVTSSPSGISLGGATASDDFEFNTNTVVTLSGWSENGWNAITYGGDCASNGTVTMSTGGKTCTATCTQVQLFP